LIFSCFSYINYNRIAFAKINGNSNQKVKQTEKEERLQKAQLQSTAQQSTAQQSTAQR